MNISIVSFHIVNIDLIGIDWQLLTMTSHSTIILASSSKYRAQLLKDQGLNPSIIKPKIDEETVKLKDPLRKPLLIAQELAYLKAKNVFEEASSIGNFAIIGSDQICVYDEQILNKPGSREKNIEHLEKLQGKSHELITCVCILYRNQTSSEDKKFETKEFFNLTVLEMKSLTKPEIEDYVDQDEPFDCAGGYRYELGGKSLMRSVVTDDITSIQGLPMTETLHHLKKLGFLEK